MAVWLKTADPDFEDRFKLLLGLKREQAADVNAAVAAIIARVRAREGDAALIELTRQFDDLDLGKVGLKVTPAEIEAAHEDVDKTTRAALELAHGRILEAP